MENKLNYYKNLLNLSYNEAIELLLKKHGPVKDDYFREKSYARFLNKEIKKITKGKYSKTDQGLYCHHIAEDKYLNLSNNEYIIKNKYPFELHKKENLVYCDLFEHLILHAIIAKDSNCEFGFPGYEIYLQPMVYDWYINQKIPKPEWMKNCYYKAYLTPDDTKIILDYIDLYLSETAFYQERLVYLEQLKKEKISRQLEFEKQEKDLRKMEEERKQEMIKQFKLTYPNLDKAGFNIDISRKEILTTLYKIKNNKDRISKKEFKEFNREMINFVREDLLIKLNSLL
ncbi:hypothetical protein K5X77_10150 (plasmid) [Vagococcus lutrae]|uniref:hypothetical protein n=1 Tax=Vagococcus lutrae TaxID=81947 RepID=UPI001C96F9AB|nr:hypothetical protein [Vagococcus lutrae]QZN89751.1 hypothetical protein K5X77_10150 [Vagococcus lutrae]